MEDRFLFRGIVKEQYHHIAKQYGMKDGEFIYGNLVYDVEIEDDRCFPEECCYIQFKYGDHYVRIEVDPKSVRQCTGLKDKYNIPIYAGDIVIILSEIDTLAVIEWDNDTAKYVIVYDGIVSDFDSVNNNELEIVGTIHENYEMLPKFIKE